MYIIFKEQRVYTAEFSLNYSINASEAQLGKMIIKPPHERTHSKNNLKVCILKNLLD